ncbi:MAG: acyltransferase [Acidimicrobiia bacterium]|nr:acyltransferase [Acidimicrobiia bacterium]
MLARYLDGVDRAVAATPPTRNRVVDAWRVIALGFVVLGHWLSASIWVQSDGSILAGNTLEWFPAAEHLTWIFQVMPIFFLAGGYANAAALDHTTGGARVWTTTRFRRLFTPAVPVVVVWTILAVVLGPVVPANVLHAGVLSATLPLWFIAVYLIMVMLAPITFRWWRARRWPSVMLLAGAAIVVDIVRFGAGIEWIGWVNYLFVWAAVHQVGFAWFDRETSGHMPPRRVGLGLIAVGMGMLVMTTAVDFYPTSMVTIPGGGISNMTPPTFANGFLAIAQLGVIVALLPQARRFAAKRLVWRVVVGVSGAMMTIYLWHLTSLSLLGAAGIFLGDGWLFSFEPGTTLWWWLRPPFIAVLAAITVLLVSVFLVFERRIRRVDHAPGTPVWVLGMVGCIAGSGAMALTGLVDTEARINWWIPTVVIGAAALTGAWPELRSRSPVPD